MRIKWEGAPRGGTQNPWFIHGFQMFPGCISHNMSGMGLAPPCRSCPQVPAQPALGRGGRGRRRMRPEPSCWASCPLIFKDNLRRSVPNMVGKTKWFFYDLPHQSLSKTKAKTWELNHLTWEIYTNTNSNLRTSNTQISRSWISGNGINQ
jgi:hypothetical protein